MRGAPDNPALGGNISPHVYVLATLGTALASILLFLQRGFEREDFIAPIFALAAVYGVINLVRQIRGAGGFRIETRPDLRRLAKAAVARYLVWLPIVFLASRGYRWLPLYNNPSGQPSLYFLERLLELYLIFGLPYFLLTLVFKSSRVEDFYDPAVRIIHMLRHVLSPLLPGRRRGRPARVFRKRYNRKVLLGLVMRAYFLPLMVSQVYGNLQQALVLAGDRFHGYAPLVILYWLTALLWLCDTINASVAYALESRWLENRSRSIDLTLTGWAVCLFCYYPLNHITGTLFPFAYLVVNDDPAGLVVPSLGFLYGVKILEVSLLVLHIYVDVSLGPSVANITLKRLQTRGPYGIVRHPGTTSKLFFWLAISACYSAFWSLPIILGQLAWSVLYVLRALTEERHLRQHETYRTYMQTVKYRFIPGLL